MKIDVSLVQPETLRKAIVSLLESEEHEFQQVNFWDSLIKGDVSVRYKNTLVAAELSSVKKMLKSSPVTSWAKYVRSQAPYFLVYLKKQEDQKHSFLINNLFEMLSGRMKVVSLWDKHIDAQKKTLGRWMAKIAKRIDPSNLLEVRVSKKDKSIWLQFGDGFSRTVDWKELPFSRRRPRLILESAEIADDGWTLAFEDYSNEIYDVDSRALRMLVSREFKKQLQGEDRRARKEVGNRLRTWRNSKNISQIELAGRSGLAQAVISRIERGYHHPRLDTLQKYATALDLDVPTLLEGPH